MYFLLAIYKTIMVSLSLNKLESGALNLKIVSNADSLQNQQDCYTPQILNFWITRLSQCTFSVNILEALRLCAIQAYTYD